VPDGANGIVRSVQSHAEESNNKERESEAFSSEVIIVNKLKKPLYSD